MIITNLAFKLNGAGLNTNAIGALIEIRDGDRTQIREIRASNNFVSQSPAEAYLGPGAAATVDLMVFWPDGTQTVLNAVAADQLLAVQHP